MQEQLLAYQTKIKQQYSNQKQQATLLKKNYLQQIEKELDLSLEEHLHQYQLSRRSFQQDDKTIQYYLSLVKAPQPQDQEEFLEQPRDESFSKSLKNVSLYALFKSIDDKIIFNRCLLNNFEFSCELPKNCGRKERRLSSQRTLMLEEHLRELRELFTSSPNFQKLNKPELRQFQEIQAKYRALQTEFSHNKLNLNTHLKIKDSLGCVLASLSFHSFLTDMDLSVVSLGGTIAQSDYETLGELIMKDRYFAKNIKLRLMDMEFCQEKCDTLKRYLKKMKVLETLIIHNYYSECKLGLFEDFNWHPFRKKVNIKSGVWK